MWEQLADETTIQKTVQALRSNGMGSLVMQTSQEAKEKIVALIPKGAEVMTMTSMTLEALGILPVINDSGEYASVRKKLLAMDRTMQAKEMSIIGGVPEWVIGSVHAVTEDGHVLVASNTGSQIPAYVYGAAHVIWVVGTQKIVADVNQGMKRINEYCLPLEDARMKKARGVGSAVNKILIINKEIRTERITLLFVKEKLGF